MFKTVSVAFVALFVLTACASTSQLDCETDRDSDDFLTIHKRFRGCPDVSPHQGRERACLSPEEIDKLLPFQRFKARLKCM